MKTLNQTLHLPLFWTVIASWVAVTLLGLGAEKLPKLILGAAILSLLFISLYFYRKTWAQVSRIENRGREGQCFKHAIDHLDAKVMLLDEHGVIYYYNNTLYRWFRQHELEVEREVVGFAASRLAGQRFTALFEEDDQLKTFLATLAVPMVVKKTLANFHFALRFIPLLDHEDNRLGVAIEWQADVPEVVVGTDPISNETEQGIEVTSANVQAEIESTLVEEIVTPETYPEVNVIEETTVAIDAAPREMNEPLLHQAALLADPIPVADMIAALNSQRDSEESVLEETDSVENEILPSEATVQKEKMRLNEARLKENLAAFSNVLLQTQALQAMAEKLDAHLKKDEPKFLDLAQTLFELAKESEASREAIFKIIQESASTNQSRAHAS